MIKESKGKLGLTGSFSFLITVIIFFSYFSAIVTLILSILALVLAGIEIKVGLRWVGIVLILIQVFVVIMSLVGVIYSDAIQERHQYELRTGDSVKEAVILTQVVG